MNNLVSNKKLLLFFVVIGVGACILSFYFFIQGINISYQISAAEVRYNLIETVQNTSDSKNLIKEKARLSLSSQPSDMVLLAQLNIEDAKRTGQTSGYDEAEKLALKALKLAPTQSEIRGLNLVLVKVLVARHQFEQSLAITDKVFGVNLNPESAFQKAFIYLALNRFEDALKEINFLIKIKPDMSSATLKALVLSYVGQDELAFHYFKKAIKLEDVSEESQSVLTRGQFAQFLLKKGNFKGALQLCDDALKINPQNSFVKQVKASVLIQKNKFSESYQLLSAAFAESKEPVFLMHMLNASKLMNKNSSDFEALAKEIQSVYQEEKSLNNYGHLVDLASVHYVLGEYQKAIDTVLLDRKSKRTFRADVLMAKSLIQLNKIESARDILEEQIARGSTDASLYYLMIEVLPGEFNRDLRELYLQKAKKVNPNFNLDLLLKIP